MVHEQWHTKLWWSPLSEGQGQTLAKPFIHPFLSTVPYAYIPLLHPFMSSVPCAYIPRFRFIWNIVVWMIIRIPCFVKRFLPVYMAAICMFRHLLPTCKFGRWPSSLRRSRTDCLGTFLNVARLWRFAWHTYWGGSSLALPLKRRFCRLFPLWWHGLSSWKKGGRLVTCPWRHNLQWRHLRCHRELHAVNVSWADDAMMRLPDIAHLRSTLAWCDENLPKVASADRWISTWVWWQEPTSRDVWRLCDAIASSHEKTHTWATDKPTWCDARLSLQSQPYRFSGGGLLVLTKDRQFS